MLRVIVLGAAAGGGFPQWNSNAPGCRRARAGDPAARPRTQASLAVSADGERWVVLNASPDLRQQIAQTPALHPRGAIRSSPIASVVLTGGDVDVIAGLLTLRERQALRLYGTEAVLGVLAGNSVFNVLSPEFVTRETMTLGQDTPIRDGAGAETGVSVELFAVPGKVPLYLEEDDRPAIAETENTVGAAVRSGSSVLFFIPGCAQMSPGLAARLRGAALVFFDGTLWQDDEMIRAGLGPKTGRRMGHMSVSGPEGTMAAFRELGVERRVLIHINNSNPILLDDSPERAQAEAEGWEVAFDGMEMSL